MKRCGFSLIETVLYIGLLALILPSFVLFTLGFLQKNNDVDMRIRMEQKASLLLWELEEELTSATTLNITASLLERENSSLIFLDASGNPVTLDRPSVAVMFPGGEKTVQRLRMTRNTESEWITDADMSVENWFLEPVRNSSGILTGLRVSLTLQTLNEDGNVIGDEQWSSTTTMHLLPHITEL